MIDTHVHLYDSAFDPDREQVVERAKNAGVTHCILPAIDKSTYPAMQECLEKYPGFCYKAMGLHPTSVGADHDTELGFAYSKMADAVAIGEIGLDFYWSREHVQEQIRAFEQQLEWARDLDLPVIIHSRSAFPELLASLKKCAFPGIRGVLHAWSGSREIFEQACRTGDFFMGIGGVVTFKNARLASVVKETGLERIVLETDAPWLTPSPYRGKRNESAYLSFIAQKIADLKDISLEKVMDQTTQNALSLFF
ncbi:MAG TPA: TatD family hydrolase [Bacteroidales bacterium]|nr:TatD family hydrolase [Bacteroidales bacterium]HRW94762.1 TatD family hydrolase [Bacteroidales bacterium]